MNQPTEEIIKKSQALNHFILEQANFHHNYQALSNPYSGMGIFTDNITQLFYKAHFLDPSQNNGHLVPLKIM